MAWPCPPRTSLFIHTLRIVSQVLCFRMGFKYLALELWHLRRGQLYRSGIFARLPNPAAYCCVPMSKLSIWREFFRFPRAEEAS
jgi:hypothetical protein